MRIFIAHGENACGTCTDHRHALVHSLADRCNVEFGISLCRVDEAVRDLGNTAAALFLEKVHTISDGIEHCHKILAELRIVVVHIAAMEIGHIIFEATLVGSLCAHPFFESLARIFGECTVLVDSQHTMHGGLHRCKTKHEIHHRCHFRGAATHEIGACQKAVAQLGRRLVVAYAGGLYYVADTHVIGARHLAPLAVEAVFEGVVVEIGIFQAIALAVGAGLLRSRICSIDSSHGAVHRADGALYALFEIVGAYIFNLIFHCRDSLR